MKGENTLQGKNSIFDMNAKLLVVFLEKQLQIIQKLDSIVLFNKYVDLL